MLSSENYAVLANTFHLNLISHWIWFKSETIIVSNISCIFSYRVNEKHGECPEPLHPDQIPVVVQHLHAISRTSFDVYQFYFVHKPSFQLQIAGSCHIWMQTSWTSSPFVYRWFCVFPRAHVWPTSAVWTTSAMWPDTSVISKPCHVWYHRRGIDI